MRRATPHIPRDHHVRLLGWQSKSDIWELLKRRAHGNCDCTGQKQLKHYVNQVWRQELYMESSRTIPDNKKKRSSKILPLSSHCNANMLIVIKILLNLECSFRTKNINAIGKSGFGGVFQDMVYMQFRICFTSVKYENDIFSLCETSNVLFTLFIIKKPLSSVWTGIFE